MHKGTTFRILPLTCLPEDPSQQVSSSMTEEGITQTHTKSMATIHEPPHNEEIGEAHSHHVFYT